MTAPLIVELPIRIESVANLREGWKARWRRAKGQKEATALCTLGKSAPPVPCVVLLTRIGPRALDGDNLQSGFKNVRDTVADWLGVKDNDPRVRWEYAQERGKPREYAARVTITAVAE